MESDREVARLDLKTVEAETLAQLELVGCSPGMRVLDAGCGSGAVTQVMADVIGPGGSAIGFDGSADRLVAASERSRGLPAEFCRGSLDSLPFREAFDLVWSRFVLEYLSDPQPALEQLYGAVRPGGKLVVGDVDDHGLRHHPISHLVEDGLDRLRPALRGRFDPQMGRRLFSMVRALGVEEIDVHLLPYHVYAGRAPDEAIENWSTKFEVIRPAAVGAFDDADHYDRFVGAFLEMLTDDDVFTYSTLVLVEARKPVATG